ncbi:conserved domain protein [Ruminococcus albus 8]|uniref:Conserved domain protein n=1 Tax=Ruminococcus albus 8 TaxID=246199 RepID=E9SCX2_RUMAL|nr:conserved domain protein [Ruminococcus albus 8]
MLHRPLYDVPIPAIYAIRTHKCSQIFLKKNECCGMTVKILSADTSVDIFTVIYQHTYKL